MLNWTCFFFRQTFIYHIPLEIFMTQLCVKEIVYEDGVFFNRRMCFFSLEMQYTSRFL